MDTILSIVAAVIPVVFVCVFVYLKDGARPEKPKHLLFTFLLGAAFAWPAQLLENFIGSFGYQNSTDWLPYTLFMFLGVALINEVLKYIPVLIYPFQKSFFDEPLDGIVYCVFAAMGFALVKLLLFVNVLDWGAMWGKATLSIPAHGAFAMLTGYYLGRARGKAGALRNRLILTGLFWAVVAHGLYEWMLFNPFSEVLKVASVVVLLACWIVALRLTSKHAQGPDPTPLASGR